MKNYNKVIAAIVAGVVCSAVTSQASLVTANAGDTGTTVGTGYSTAGDTQVATTGALSYVFGLNNVDAGSVTTQVFNNDANNTVGGLTGLVFLYTIQITSGDISGITLNGNWLGTIGLANVTGSVQNINGFNYKFDGSNVKVGWVGGVLGTLQFVVDTSATAYQLSLSGLQDSAPDGGVNILSPAPVPEPATVVAGALLLLPLGVGAVRSLRKERVA
jgi:hypothetical protein